MSRHLRFGIGALILVLFAAAVQAQDGAPAAPPPRPTDQDAGMPVIVKHDPAVDTIMESNPQTPRELLRAASILADLDRADLAKQYLQKVLAAKLNDDALAELAVHVDSDALLRMATNKALQPEGAQVADAVLGAAARQARDPKVLAAAIDKLSDPSPAARQHAIGTILAAHEDAVPSLVLALADEKRAAVQPIVKETLAHIGPAAIAPLAAALQSNNTALKLQIIDVLSQIGLREAVPYLVAPATAASSPPEVREAARSALLEIQNITRPTVESAAKLLMVEIEKYLKHQQLLKPDAEGKISVWRWDAASGVPVREKMSPDQADVALAARLADDLNEVAPEDPRAQRLFLMSVLEAAGSGQQAAGSMQRAAKMGAPAVEDALQSAMSSGTVPAAIGAAQLLGAIGDRTLLDAKGANPRPLVLALEQRDRRLRFAAAEAIMKLDPKAGFNGSSDLVNVLAWIAGTSNTRRALVAFPNEAVATQLGAMLATMGYDADIATNGRNAFLKALASSDYELALLSSRIDRPPVWVVLQEMRHDPRSARLPVILLGEDGEPELDHLETLTLYDPWTKVFSRPVTVEGMKFFVERLNQEAGSFVVPIAEREEQAAKSLTWLKKLNETSAREFEIQTDEAEIARALNVPKLSAAAAELLGLIGTHTAQRALVEMADRTSAPIEMRQAAAAAFSQSVRKHGIQLTTREIQHQYDRYNESATEDAASQQLLGLILDAIELPRSLTNMSRPSSLVPRP